MPPRKRARSEEVPLATIHVPANAAHASATLQGIAQLWRDGSLTDCTVTVEGREFKAHRTVLAASSAFMKSAFCGGMSETAKASITLQEFRASTFEIILTWMYEGSTRFPEDALTEVFQAASQLQAVRLVADLEHVVIEKMTPSSAFSAMLRKGCGNFKKYDLACHKKY